MMQIPFVNKEALRETLHQLLRYWLKGDAPDLTPLTNLRLYLRLVAQMDQASPETVGLVRQLLDQVLALLQERDEAAANLLRRRYLDDTSTQEMSQRLTISESHYYKLQNEALNQLTELVLAEEQQACAEHRLAIEARLEPLSYRRLFGVSRERQRLRSAIEREDEPWLLAVDGIGGIGKTSLADELVRDIMLASRFYDIAWVSARQQYFLPAAGIQPTNRPALDAESLIEGLLDQLHPALPPLLSAPEKFVTLAKLLKKRPYLIVIDNLETSADYQALLPTLHKLAGPTKFLLTSRHSLCTYSDVFCISLRELDQADTLAFLQYEAEVRGLQPLANASLEQLQSIYEVVGGNPLALKLVIGQICALPLSQVLENLRQARGKKISELYTYIYWQIWHALNAGSRQILLAMPLSAALGSTFTHLATVSGLEPAELSQALEELTLLSLVEVGGDLEQRRYRIHRLTETFLLTEVTRWS